MHIEFVEISNFRKLLSVRVDLAEKTTLFVGANNSGKTSAMEALRYFLVTQQFSINDFTLSHWEKINAIGRSWEAGGSPDLAEAAADLAEWEGLLPSLDLWFNVADDEIHHVSRILPTLEWESGLLGVRLRFEPTDVAALAADYVACAVEAKETKAEAEKMAEGEDCDVKLWPQDLLEYLSRRLNKRFEIKLYALDPKMCASPLADNIARPQPLPIRSEPIEDNPLKSLIRVDEINAQRGLGQGVRGDEGASGSRDSRRLTDQAKSYYANHLDPSDRPQPSDIIALRAIEKAQELFDKTLTASFSSTLKEVGDLGYPGQTDPQIKVSARISPAESLNHDAAVQYEVAAVVAEGEATTVLRLPEHYNGLGYQNLLLMVFRLMGYRDGWMRVGKMSRASGDGLNTAVIPPLHLVLVEEPEAHLHAQVQQVFIRKAYDILRKHEHLGDGKQLRTQLVVSTHSSHVAHETKFACLRYFRRLPATKAGAVPTSSVINLADVFGPDKETERFDTRYLRATHCDLFFADAVILVEGPAERMLVPHFIRSHFSYLTQCYLSILEIGGSHAHRLKPLIEKLGLLSLVVTDLDAKDATGSATQPARGANQESDNTTVRDWIPGKSALDELLDLPPEGKITKLDQLCSIRAAYQCPVHIDVGGKTAEVIPSTFEDALVFANLQKFRALAKATGLMEKCRKAVADSGTAADLAKVLYDHLHNRAKKAEFALDLLELQDPEKLVVPPYLYEGLEWLQAQLRGKHVEVFPPIIETDDPDQQEEAA